ncbi:MAG TPA: acyltransferase family protein [Trebonia sp.]|jgi:peptidoglycan/LPS O-acetylase OafA/YrhL|nr:acyltransferase family protein [Trebonia sp.]
MPEPVKGDQKYLPGLDGLRALAVAAVVAYHLGYGWAQGGLLGVGVFFTLSGYLITDILVGQWAARGRIKLGEFWLRRARRLLPALFVMLAVVTIWVNGFARTFVPAFRGNVVASVFYVSNWWFIDQHTSYYARFAPPTPLDHLWSLAVEEQFYLVWPWVVLLLVWLVSRGAKRRSRAAAFGRPVPAHARSAVPPYLNGRARAVLCAVTLVLAAASAVWMLKEYQPGYDPTRVYEGTDTRAFGLLIGAALAMVWPTRRLGAGGSPVAWKVPTAARWLIDAAGLAGLAGILALIWRTNEYSGFMFHGGMVLLSVATAATVGAAVTPGSLFGKALGVQPLRWIGVRSYGIYLWHYPVIVLTAAAGTAGTAVSPVRAVAVVTGTVLAAAISWRFVEDPIRSGARLRWITPGQAGKAGRLTETEAAKTPGGASVTSESGPGGQRPGWPRPSSPPAIAGVCLLVAAVLAGGVTATLRLASASHPVAARASASAANARLSNSGGQQAADGTAATGGGTVNGSGANAAGTAASAGGASQTAGTAGTGGTGGTAGATGTATGQGTAGAVTIAAAGPAATVPALPTPPPMTSCTSVVHIGDSTSEGLISSDYEPNPANRIQARYADVGVKKSIMKIVGATSVVESLPGTPNAYDMANSVLKSGYNGCWVIALGTNDTADVAVGSEISRVQRVQKMMKLIGSQPVMWVEAVSLLSSGPYAEANMRAWNDALKQVAQQYPNMKIYNWPAVAQKSWFINDGIHYTSLGYKERGIAIANALAENFPAS